MSGIIIMNFVMCEGAKREARTSEKDTETKERCEARTFLYNLKPVGHVRREPRTANFKVTEED